MKTTNLSVTLRTGALVCATNNSVYWKNSDRTHVDILHHAHSIPTIQLHSTIIIFQIFTYINYSTLVFNFIFHHENPSESDGRKIFEIKTLLVVVSFMLFVVDIFAICYLVQIHLLILSRKLRNSDCKETVTP